MKIEILGMGCWRCKTLEENTRKAVKETGVKANIEKVTEIDRIVEYGITATPAIAIDGKVKAYGRIPEVEEIKKWLE